MTSTNVKYIAIDDCGNCHRLGTKHPRQELMMMLGAKHAEKVYVDPHEHVGYIIQGRWYTLYAVEGRGPRK